MNWINEPWRKLYTRTTASWNRRSFAARGLAYELLRTCADDGFIADLEGEDPGEVISAVVNHRSGESETIKNATEELLKDGYLEIQGDRIFIRNFVEAQTKRSSTAVKQARYRQRTKSEELEEETLSSESDNAAYSGDVVSKESTLSVTHEGNALRNAKVTRYGGVTVPLRNTVTDTIRNETIRNETKRDEGEIHAHARVEPALPDSRIEQFRLIPDEPKPAKQRKEKPAVPVEHRLAAGLVLDALNEARKRLVPTSRAYTQIDKNLTSIVERLAEGRTLDDCMHVVRVCEAECQMDLSKFRWFDVVTPFLDKNFKRNLGQDLSVISKPPDNNSYNSRRWSQKPTGLRPDAEQDEQMRKLFGG